MENARRSIVKIIKEICSESEISYRSFSYDWIFCLQKDDKVAYIFGYQFDKNSAAAYLICSDKCSTSDLLKVNQIPVVEHTFFMSPINIKYVGVAGNWKKISELLQKNSKLVCKANEGTGGNSVYLVSNQFELENATQKIFESSRAMAICPYYEIESEFRVVILDKCVKLIYQKNISYVVGDGVLTIRQLLLNYLTENVDCSISLDIPDEDNLKVINHGKKYYLNWKHNLGQGADPVIVEDQELIKYLSDLALRAAEAVNVKFASVDIIKTGDDFLVLEINSGVMMEYFSQLNDENYQIAKSIYKEAIESMFE